MISSLEQQKHELEEKLRKLREFNQVSPEIFKEVEAFQQVVQKGLSQVQTSWNPVKKAFNIPSGKELEWAEASYDKYLNVEMRKIDKKAENGKLNKEDGKIIKAYAAKHPEEELPMNLQDYIIKNKKSIGRDIGFDISSTLLEQGGYQAHKFGVFINTVGGVRGPEGPNSFVQVKRNHGDALIKQRGTIAHVGKYGGKAISGVGFGLGMYDDIANDGKTVGEAISHNTLTAGAGIGAGALVSGISTAALASNPVGWAIIGGMTLGIGATIAVDWAYQSNWKGIKDKTDWIGNKIDNGIDTAKDKLVEGVKKKREIQEYATNKVSNIVNNTVKSVKKEVAKEAEHVVGQAIEKAKDSINPMRWQW